MAHESPGAQSPTQSSNLPQLPRPAPEQHGAHERQRRIPHRDREEDPERPEPSDARQDVGRSEEHTSELQSHHDLVCRLLLEKKKKKSNYYTYISNNPVVHSILPYTTDV